MTELHLKQTTLKANYFNQMTEQALGPRVKFDSKRNKIKLSAMDSVFGLVGNGYASALILTFSLLLCIYSLTFVLMAA